MSNSFALKQKEIFDMPFPFAAITEEEQQPPLPPVFYTLDSFLDAFNDVQTALFGRQADLAAHQEVARASLIMMVIFKMSIDILLFSSLHFHIFYKLISTTHLNPTTSKRIKRERKKKLFIKLGDSTIIRDQRRHTTESTFAVERESERGKV